MWGRSRVDVGSMWGRCRVDVGSEILKNSIKIVKESKNCGEGGKLRLRRENNKNCEILEEGIKKLRNENNKIVEEEESKKMKRRGVSKTLFAV